MVTLSNTIKEILNQNYFHFINLVIIDVEPNICFRSYEFYDPPDSPYFVVLIPLVVKLQFFIRQKNKR